MEQLILYLWMGLREDSGAKNGEHDCLSSNCQRFSEFFNRCLCNNRHLMLFYEKTTLCSGVMVITKSGQCWSMWCSTWRERHCRNRENFAKFLHCSSLLDLIQPTVEQPAKNIFKIIPNILPGKVQYNQAFPRVPSY